MVWTTLGTVGSQALVLVTSVTAARYLGRTAYGELGAVTSTVQTLLVFGTLGLGLAATKYVAEWRESDAEKTGRIIALSLVFASLIGGAMALAYWSAAPFLADVTLNAKHLTPALACSSPLLLLYAVSWAQGGALQGFENFKGVAQLTGCRALLTLAVTIWAVPHCGILGAVWASVAGCAVAVLVGQASLIRSCRRWAVRLAWRAPLREWRLIYRFSLPAVMGTALIGPATWGANMILINSTHGYAEMGLLTVAYQWRIGVCTIPTLLGAVSLPLLSNLYGKSDFITYRFLVKHNLLIGLASAAALSVPICLAAPWILPFYGSTFRDGLTAFVIMVASSLPSAISGITDQGLLGAGLAWQSFALNALWVLIFLGTTKALVGWGALGVANAFLLSYTFRAVVGVLYMKRAFSYQLATADEAGVTAQ